ncbi:response regulator transcription factor [Paenibacillus sacheonensis]|uniref:Response regulator n=1 Tax=Paenibacillus sacheonensis TaxID=742054 RepID=A0A7X4YM96_9BACL|nr:response regulator transcription factor [Paenibacillus sacheonensis]MBM7563411.1 two-component system response regulator YesN [Paenibacillus sacheonensis]NBC68034.1 response regulator [Paenibacillus sacheonensis]
MYKVLLVDDEPFITEGLSDAVDWSAFGLEVVGSAEDGEEALERLREVNVDLLITDISMPIMNGLELIRAARELQPQLKVIILSGYNEFDYLKEGMRLGIENYVLKPIRFEELEATLEGTVRKLDADKPMPAFGRDEIGILRDNVMTRWANGRIAFPELAERTSLLGIDLSKPYAALAIMRFGPVMGHAAASFHPTAAADSSEAADAGNAVAEQEGSADLGSPWERNSSAEPIADLLSISSEELLVIPFHNEDGDLVAACCIDGSEQAKAKLTETLERLAAIWESRQWQPRIALGETAPMVDAAVSYGQARKAQQFFLVLPERQLIDYARISAETSALPTELFEWEPYAKAITAKDKDELTRRIKRDFAVIRALEGLHPARARGAAVELMILMKMEVDKLRRADTADVFKELLDSAVSAESLAGVEDALATAAFFAADSFSGEDMSPVVKQALRYIHEHYEEPLTLKSLGLQFHIHPNYLGQLFHKQTSDTFTDYLNKYRIERAKELLADSRLKVSEIARQVGYWETGYFYKQFKKHVGMVPGEYKELL